jgi:hypothetical protein
MNEVAIRVKRGLEIFGFREVAALQENIPGGILLLKRQTWNTNRAVVLLEIPEPPADMAGFLKRVRGTVARKVRFFPFLYGVGIQIIVMCPDITTAIPEPRDYVAKVDNQWAIVQSLYLIDPRKREYLSGKTWGQVITGKFQSAIEEAVSELYRNARV